MGKPKVGVVGAGAIGGICAGLIKNAGYDVQVVVRTQDHAQRVMSEGIRISGIKGDTTLVMNAVSHPGDMSPDRDLVLLGVKATQMLDVAEQLLPVLKPEAMVVTMAAPVGVTSSCEISVP